MAYKFKTKEYTTSRGHKITLREIPILAISSMRQDYIEAYGEFPPTPTYETPTGETMVLHENQIETDEEKAKWDEYQAKTAEWEQGFVQFQFGFMAIEAVVWDEKLEGLMAEWEAKSRAMKRKVPEDIYEKRIKFAQTEIFTGVQDMGGISQALGELSGAPVKEAGKLAATFPS